MKSHPTVIMAIKEVEVDEVIAPLIEWMNEHFQLYTHFCCQGEKATNLDGSVEEPDGELEPLDDCDKPYVVWTCAESLTLAKLLNLFNQFGETKVEWYEFGACVRYITRFRDQQSLEELIEIISP